MATTPKGGRRPGAGRKSGTATKRTQLIAEAALAEGITPLEYMLKVMRNEPDPLMETKDFIAATMMRFEAAKAAAPYIHPRLAAIEHTGKDGESLAPPVLNIVIGSDSKDAETSS